MIGDFFNTFLINPLTNLYVLLTVVSGNAGIAVILLTVLIRLVTLPLFVRQMHTMRAMAAIQPRMQEIQKKYKDPRRRSEEQMKLYREMGINPLGCLSSMIIQLPILMALYRTFSHALATTPESLIGLSNRLYGWSVLREAVPLHDGFLWLNLGRPDPFVIPLLTAVTTYVLQKMSTLPPTDEKQAAQNNMMNMMMPLIFAWITISLPSGLGLYYVLSNLIGMVMQYFYVGGGPINWRGLVGLSQGPVLPRALDAKKKHEERARRAGSENGAGPAEEEAQEKTTSAGARRRRRYASGGRRRGRR